MTTILFFLIVWLVCKALKAIYKRAKPEHIPHQDKRKIDYMASLLALQQQRDIYNDLLSDIDLQLDSAPANREKLLKDKAMIYSKLATVEQKITKLIS